jgi:outer membrane protein OmpU
MEISMRKFLLSTSAIAGVSLMSSVAMADVTISGTFEWGYDDADSSVASNDGTSTGSTNEVNIDFTNKTDSGLTVTYNTDLDTDGGGIDDNSLTISGGFGSITLGETDGASDAFGMNPLSLVQEESGGSLLGASGTTGNVMTSTGGKLDGNGDKVTYKLPAMGGLTAGASFQNGGVAGGTDTQTFGFAYAMEAGGNAITLGYSSANQEAVTTDNDGTSLGVKVVTAGGITFMVAQGTEESNGEDLTAQSAGISYTLANGITLNAGTINSEDDIDTGEEYTMSTYEAFFTIAYGLTAVVIVSDFDY